MKKLKNENLAKLITTMDDIGLVKGKMIKICFRELNKRSFSDFDEVEVIVTKHRCSTGIMKKLTKIAKKHYRDDKTLFVNAVERVTPGIQ